MIAWQKPNLLLLDEPTNHLDLEVRHALTVALQEFAGAVLVISHDRHLLRNTVDQFLLVDDGQVTPFDGNLDDYQRWLSKRDNSASKADSVAKAPPSQAVAEKKVDKKEARQQAAQRREQLKPLTSALKKLEREIDSLNGDLSDLEQQLADPELYSNGDNAEQLQALLKVQGEKKNRLAECEEQWLETSEALEGFTD